MHRSSLAYEIIPAPFGKIIAKSKSLQSLIWISISFMVLIISCSKPTISDKYILFLLKQVEKFRLTISRLYYPYTG